MGGWGVSTTKYQCLELTDLASFRNKRTRTMKSVLNRFFPHPLRYKKVWNMNRGDKSLVAWKAIAPDGYIALGMIVTSTGMIHAFS